MNISDRTCNTRVRPFPVGLTVGRVLIQSSAQRVYAVPSTSFHSSALAHTEDEREREPCFECIHHLNELFLSENKRLRDFNKEICCHTDS